MDQWKALPLGRQLILGGGLLLLIDTFLPWQRWDIGPFTLTHNAWDGGFGVLLGLATIAVVGWVAARALEVSLPEGLPDGLTTLVLGAATVGFALIKNLADSNSTVWAYIGVILAAVVAYGSWLVYSGGESVRHADSPTDAKPS
jgi:hypothetical protein